MFATGPRSIPLRIWPDLFPIFPVRVPKRWLHLPWVTVFYGAGTRPESLVLLRPFYLSGSSLIVDRPAIDLESRSFQHGAIGPCCRKHSREISIPAVLTGPGPTQPCLQRLHWEEGPAS